jgi:hypothetical protein
MRKAGADNAEVNAAEEILDVVKIINMGDTDASQRAAIESILKINESLDVYQNEEKAKAQGKAAQEEPNRHILRLSGGKSITNEYGGN